MCLVSVVVPTRDRPGTLTCTLRSILAQRLVDFEVIVIDDGSRQPVKIEADSRVQVLRHETSVGVSAARNTGIAAARGHWIAFCDDDDLWAPDKLSAQLAAAVAARASWAYTGDITIDDQLRVIGGGPPLAPAEVLKLLRHENVVRE